MDPKLSLQQHQQRPDTSEKIRGIDASDMQTAMLPAIKPEQARRSLLIRRPVLDVDADPNQAVISKDLAELIKHRENVAHQETMMLQALVADQERLGDAIPEPRRRSQPLQPMMKLPSTPPAVRPPTAPTGLPSRPAGPPSSPGIIPPPAFSQQGTMLAPPIMPTRQPGVTPLPPTRQPGGTPLPPTRQPGTTPPYQQSGATIIPPIQYSGPIVAPPAQPSGTVAVPPAPKPVPQQQQPKVEKKKQSIASILKEATRNIRRRRVPVLHQISMVECGAACLAMILSYHGRKTTVSEIREQCGVGRDGLSALALVKAARQYGLRVRAGTLQENDFRFITLPAIAHWEFNHFIVIERWTPKYVDIVDPASGRRRMSSDEFDAGFTGVVLMMEPGAHFSRESTQNRLSLRSYVASFIKEAPISIVQVLAASLLLQFLGLMVPLLTKVAIDNLIPQRLLGALQIFGIGMIMLVLALTVTRLLRSSILLWVQSRVDMSMMFNFFEHLFSLPQSFFLQRSSGDIMARLGSNIAIRETISNQLFSTVLDGSFAIFYFVILLTQSPTFTLVVVIIGILQAILLLSTRRVTNELMRRELVAEGKSQGYITEALAGIKTLKAAGAEHRAFEQWSNLFMDQMNVSVRRNYLGILVGTGMSMLDTIAPLALLWFGTLQVIEGNLAVGTMLALNALAGSILDPLASLIMSVRQLQLVRSHLERVADVLEAEPEQDAQRVYQPPRLSGHIRLESVSFQYDPNSPLVLEDIDLEIRPGQKIAIVGRTGSGKSTLGQLLLGLYLPTEGEIYYDGIPLSRLNYQAVRSQFGVVMQEASVFSGSIRDNIALNNPTMNMEQVIRAAQIAAIHPDIMQMPMEYETFVSEGGSALSGGQRQRLALARAVANSPVIMLLDEATSALDVVTEQAVERNISSLACTQIIIAHRLSTIRNADKILVLHEGEIVEEGTHNELLQEGGYYARLIRSQLAAGEIKAK